MTSRKRADVVEALILIIGETFSAAEVILEHKIEVLQEALRRVQLSQRELVLGLSCDVYHPDGFTSDESKREARIRLKFERG